VFHRWKKRSIEIESSHPTGFKENILAYVRYWHSFVKKLAEFSYEIDSDEKQYMGWLKPF